MIYTIKGGLLKGTLVWPFMYSLPYELSKEETLIVMGNLLGSFVYSFVYVHAYMKSLSYMHVYIQKNAFVYGRRFCICVRIWKRVYVYAHAYTKVLPSIHAYVCIEGSFICAHIYGRNFHICLRIYERRFRICVCTYGGTFHTYGRILLYMHVNIRN